MWTKAPSAPACLPGANSGEEVLARIAAMLRSAKPPFDALAREGMIFLSIGGPLMVVGRFDGDWGARLVRSDGQTSTIEHPGFQAFAGDAEQEVKVEPMVSLIKSLPLALRFRDHDIYLSWRYQTFREKHQGRFACEWGAFDLPATFDLEFWESVLPRSRDLWRRVSSISESERAGLITSGKAAAKWKQIGEFGDIARMAAWANSTARLVGSKAQLVPPP